MSQLYHLLAGTSKKRLKIVMTDKLSSVENYRDAVKPSADWNSRFRHLQIIPAEPNAKVFNKRKTNQWTNYNKPGPKVIR